MQDSDTLTRKMYSHSNRVLWAPSPPKADSSGIRSKIQVSLKQKFKDSVDRMHRAHKYERFIDNILMQHANEENIPVITKNLSKKHSYKGYRIMKTEELEANPELRSHRSEKVLPEYSPRKEERDRKERKLELPLIYKFKKGEGEGGEGKMRTERSETESERELKLKELKEKMILRYLRPA